MHEAWIMHGVSYYVDLAKSQSHVPHACMNVLFWGRCNFPKKVHGQGYAKTRLKLSFWSSVVDTGILSNNTKLPLTLHSWGWPLAVTPSIDQTLYNLMTSKLLPNWTLLTNLTCAKRGLHTTFATGIACNQRIRTPPYTSSCLKLVLDIQAGDTDSPRAPGLTSGLQGSVKVHRGALLLVPQWQYISSFVFCILLTL